MATQANLDLAQTLYIAYYGRPADRSGLNFWAEKIEADGVESVLADFGTSAEFDARFGDLTNEQLVNNLYNQLFGRNAELEGLEFWTGKLESGELNLAEIAYEIANGAQDGEGGAPDAATLAAKLAAANAFTAAIDTTEEVVGYQGDAAADAGREFLAGIEAGDEVTAEEAQAALNAVIGANNPGMTLTLTTAQDDDLVGGAGDDLFRAVDDHVLQSGDELDGGEGYDVLNIAAGAIGVDGSESAAPQIQNIERINNSHVTATLDLDEVSGVEQIWSRFDQYTDFGSPAYADYQNAVLTTTYGISGVVNEHTSVGLNLEFADGELVGDSTLNIALAGNEAFDISGRVYGVGSDGDLDSGVENVVINSAAGNAGTISFGNDELETLTITGAGDLEVYSVSGNSLELFDASASSGDITWSPSALDNESGEATVKGGSGDDMFFLGESDADLTIEGGAGDDILHGGSGNDTIVGGTGQDILIGGEGEDTFVLESQGTTIGEASLIVDFDFEAGDSIVFDGVELTEVNSAEAGDESSFNDLREAANNAFDAENGISFAYGDVVGDGDSAGQYVFFDADGDNVADGVVGVGSIEYFGEYQIA